MNGDNMNGNGRFYNWDRHDLAAKNLTVSAGHLADFEKAAAGRTRMVRALSLREAFNAAADMQSMRLFGGAWNEILVSLQDDLCAHSELCVRRMAANLAVMQTLFVEFSGTRFENDAAIEIGRRANHARALERQIAVAGHVLYKNEAHPDLHARFVDLSYEASAQMDQADDMVNGEAPLFVTVVGAQEPLSARVNMLADLMEEQAHFCLNHAVIQERVAADSLVLGASAIAATGHLPGYENHHDRFIKTAKEIIFYGRRDLNLAKSMMCSAHATRDVRRPVFFYRPRHS